MNKEKLRSTPSDSPEAVSFLSKQLDFVGSDGIEYCLEIRNMTMGTENKANARLYPKGSVIASGQFMEIEYEMLNCPLMGEHLYSYMDSESAAHGLIASQLFFPPCTRDPFPNGRIFYLKKISIWSREIIENNQAVFGLALQNLLKMMNDLYVDNVDHLLGEYPAYMVYLGYGPNGDADDADEKELDACLRSKFKEADFAVFECVDDMELDDDEYYLATFCSWALTSQKSLDIQKNIREHDEPLSEEEVEKRFSREFKSEGDWLFDGEIRIGNIQWERDRNRLLDGEC